MIKVNGKKGSFELDGSHLDLSAELAMTINYIRNMFAVNMGIETADRVMEEIWENSKKDIKEVKKENKEKEKRDKELKKLLMTIMDL